MNNNFVNYAQYYDDFNTKKNYLDESLYIDSIIKKFHPGSSSILDVGCGTGLHDIELSKFGYTMTGIDISCDMIDVAKSNLQKTSQKIDFIHDPNQKFYQNEKFDVIVSLFHVMSYQTTQVELDRIFQLISRNLTPNGIFIFDYWYTPSVEFLKLEKREKSIFIDRDKVTKIVSPTDVGLNLYNIDITLKTKSKSFSEQHLMRSFTPEEFKNSHDLLYIESFGWLTFNKPDKFNWSAVSILRNV